MASTSFVAVDSAAVNQESVTPAANERHTASLHAQSLNKSGRISFGVVTFASPYTNWYRVQLENGGTDLPCCMMSETSVLPFSVKDSSPIAPHSSVLVYHQRGLAYGIILGCLPGIVTGGVPTFSDWISQGSNGGFQRERYYSDFPQLFARAGGQIDFSNQRPLDSSAIGEWGKFSDLGGGFFLDPVMAPGAPLPAAPAIRGSSGRSFIRRRRSAAPTPLRGRVARSSAASPRRRPSAPDRPAP